MDFIMMLGEHSGNIMVVGDTDQSIYGFRGADVKYVMDKYREENFVLKYLSTNYRSTQNIVRAADGLINKNKFRIVKTSNTINETGSVVNLATLANNTKEAEFIAERIKETMAKNPDLEYKDFAILCRTQAQTYVFEKTFLNEHIPLKLKGIVPFYARTEIKDILAYLKFAYNGKDRLAFERVINVPTRGIGSVSVEKLLSVISLDDIIEADNIHEVVRLSGTKARHGLEQFVKIIRGVRQMIQAKEQVANILAYIKNNTDYNTYLEDTVDVPGTLAQKKVNLDEMLTISYGYGNNIESYLASAVLDGDDPAMLADEQVKDAVNVMTIHSAKGLEFHTVFVVGVYDNMLPFVYSHKSAEAIEEERRLFYVAMTRAKKELYLTYPSLVTDSRNQTRSANISRFILEIPRKYLRLYKASGKAA